MRMPESNSMTLSAGAHAFGDGQHPTTLGMLAALEAIDPGAFTPRAALDVGAGSGILSFAIARQFQCPVVATDISAGAVEILKENAIANGYSIRYSSPLAGEDRWGGVEKSNALSSAPLPNPPRKGEGVIIPLQADGFSHPAIAARGPYDLIVMNILAEPLLRLAHEAAAALAPGGALLLSGILTWQEPQIRDAYQSLELELATRLVVGDWVTLAFSKPAL